MQVCMVCGAANPPTAPECESCGSDLPAGQMAPPPHVEPIPADPADAKCPFCALPINPTDKECPHCRLNLDAQNPLNQPAPRGHENNLTMRYEEFQRRVEGLRVGSLSRQDFAVWLSEVKSNLEAKRNAYVETIRQSGYYDMHPEEVNQGMEGILDYEEAIEDMCEFALGNAEPSALDGALAKMWQGNEKVNDAMRMNRGFRAQLEDDWGYM